MNLQYEDDDLVYVDPVSRTVVSKVVFDETGFPAALEVNQQSTDQQNKKGENKKRKNYKRTYPWGTYKTMKRIYRIEGKEKENGEYKSLDDAISLALKEPYW